MNDTITHVDRIEVKVGPSWIYSSVTVDGRQLFTRRVSIVIEVDRWHEVHVDHEVEGTSGAAVMRHEVFTANELVVTS